MSFIRVALAFILAAAITVVIASIADSQLTLNALIAVGAEATLGDRVEMAAGYFGPFLALYGVFIAIGFLVAFLVAALAARLLPLPRALVFAVAGGVAMFVMLTLMREAFFGVDLIASARTALGAGAQVGAGVLGGWVFARISASRREA